MSSTEISADAALFTGHICGWELKTTIWQKRNLLIFHKMARGASNSLLHNTSETVHTFFAAQEFEVDHSLVVKQACYKDEINQ